MARPPTVRTRTGDCAIPTCLHAPPHGNPTFLDKRVYQDDSGRIYPLPFTERIGGKQATRKSKAIWIENEYVRMTVLPRMLLFEVDLQFDEGNLWPEYCPQDHTP